jgi:hypothetical protein
MSDLEYSATRFKTDKLSHGYIPHYDRHFSSLRDLPGVEILEIGIFKGASVRMWKDWFPFASIEAIDIDPSCKQDFGTRVSVFIEDAKMFHPVHNYDVIIDDGSHTSDDITFCFSALWPWVKPGGWYIIEDWEVQFMPAWGSPRSGTNAVVQFHGMIDELLRGAPKTDEVHLDELGLAKTSEIHVYEQIAFLRKAP